MRILLHPLDRSIECCSALGTSRETWTFQRFAPFSAARIGTDLTGAEVNDQRFALDEQLARLLREKAAFYVGGECVAHCLFIAMSDARLSRIVH